jgi:hypothetical protein
MFDSLQTSVNKFDSEDLEESYKYNFSNNDFIGNLRLDLDED